MKKIIALLVVAVVAIAGFTYVGLHIAKSDAKHSPAAKQVPGVAVNLVACGAGQSGVECLAIYKGQCAVFVFDQSGKITGAQPVDKRYCGQS